MTCPNEQDYRAAVVEDVRPWGKFRSYPRALVESIKIITVSPGAALSLQFHRRRCEFWVILDPGLEVTVGERVWRPRPDQEVFIPAETPHRLRCLGPAPGRVMELWLGPSDESDIVRLEDAYGRR
jgi:mannose-6-phosphate isomerase-like protein (cupin superfamily)